MNDRDGNGADTHNTKPSNPKDAAAFGKRVSFACLPIRALVGAALALSEGAYKYGRHNYRVAGVRASIYFDATLRHLFAWFEGQDIDPASGVHHIDKAIAGLLVLRDAQLGDMCEDDRPPRVAEDWIAGASARYEALAERMRVEFGEPKAPFTQAHTAVVDAAVQAVERATVGLIAAPAVADGAELIATADDFRFRVGENVLKYGAPGRIRFVDVTDTEIPYLVRFGSKEEWCRPGWLEPDPSPAGESG